VTKSHIEGISPKRSKELAARLVSRIRPGSQPRKLLNRRPRVSSKMLVLAVLADFASHGRHNSMSLRIVANHPMSFRLTADGSKTSSAVSSVGCGKAIPKIPRSIGLYEGTTFIGGDIWNATRLRRRYYQRVVATLPPLEPPIDLGHGFARLGQGGIR
jgi:hypothetical protein